MVPPETTIRDTVVVLDSTHCRIVMITDDQDNLLGVVTDSNIRRAIIQGMDFGQPVSEIMVSSPVTVQVDTLDEDVLAIMERTHCYQIPVVDGGKVVGVRFIDEVLNTLQKRSSKLAVVMAGGLGQRLRPLTETTPKPLLKVGEKPILFLILDQLIAAGFDRIVVTVNYKRDMIREAIEAVPGYRSIVSLVEEETRMGTAGALSLLPFRPTQPFLVINCDVLTNVPLMEIHRFHRAEKNKLTMAIKEHQHTVPYGTVKLEGSRIVALEEKPTVTLNLNIGIYVLEPEVLDFIPAGEPRDMTDVVGDLLGAGERVGCFPLHEYWLDIGAPAQLERARREVDTVVNGNGTNGKGIDGSKPHV